MEEYQIRILVLGGLAFILVWRIFNVVGRIILARKRAPDGNGECPRPDSDIDERGGVFKREISVDPPPIKWPRGYGGDSVVRRGDNGEEETD